MRISTSQVYSPNICRVPGTPSSEAARIPMVACDDTRVCKARLQETLTRGSTHKRRGLCSQERSTYWLPYLWHGGSVRLAIVSSELASVTAYCGSVMHVYDGMPHPLPPAHPATNIYTPTHGSTRGRNSAHEVTSRAKCRLCNEPAYLYTDLCDIARAVRARALKHTCAHTYTQTHTHINIHKIRGL